MMAELLRSLPMMAALLSEQLVEHSDLECLDAMLRDHLLLQVVVVRCLADAR